MRSACRSAVVTAPYRTFRSSSSRSLRAGLLKSRARAESSDFASLLGRDTLDAPEDWSTDSCRPDACVPPLLTRCTYVRPPTTTPTQSPIKKKLTRYWKRAFDSKALDLPVLSSEAMVTPLCPLAGLALAGIKIEAGCERTRGVDTSAPLRCALRASRVY